MQLAVISYPYHYHITQLAIRHALMHIDGITDVKVIWDDRTISAPNGYIPFSSVCYIPSYIKGWYAQQVVKLNLHNVLSGDMLILDGDVILNEKFNPTANFYAPYMGDKSKEYSTIKTLLGIEQFNFINAPFMHVNSMWLKELHELLPNINQIYFETAMSNWTSKGSWPISEWELLYRFLSNIKKIERPVVPFWFNLKNTDSFEAEFNTSDNFILDGKDNFTVDFYQKHSITVNETLWKQLYGPIDYRLGR